MFKDKYNPLNRARQWIKKLRANIIYYLNPVPNTICGDCGFSYTLSEGCPVCDRV